jgi:hypothetical protein
MGSLLSTVRFTDCDFVFGVIPPINRWAIIIRPLRGLVELLFVQDLSLQSPNILSVIQGRQRCSC